METTTNAPATVTMPSNSDIRLVPTDQIIPDPNQPRKTFYKLTMEELRESVRKDNIMQSLLLRKHGDRFMIIFGERRHRVASELGIKEVPAIVIEATDEEALAKQLVENLQRENLLPMEQANGFKLLADKCGMNAKDIALSVGKTEYFVRQQIKLTELIKPWQKIVAKNGIHLTTALQISTLPEAVQKELYQYHVSAEDEKAERPVIQITPYTLNKYKGLLADACFDIADATLDTKMGACTQCPFNSACHSLFPNEQENPKCNNIACFKNKTTLHQNREFNKAKDDPTVLLVYEANSIPDYLKKIKSEGNEIFKLGYADDCKEIKEPKKPDWNESVKWGKKQKMTDKEIKADFKKDEDNYQFAKQVYDKNIASGKYKKAFVAYDDNERSTGKYVYVEMNPVKKAAKDAKKNIAQGNASLQDIDNEIKRILDREARAKELDEEKIHTKIVDALKECKSLKELPKGINKIDTLLLRFLVSEQISWTDRSEVQKIIKSPAVFNTDDPTKFYKNLELLSKEQISFLIRLIILQKYSTNLPTTKGGVIVRQMAESLGVVPIAEFEKEQKAIAVKRQERVNERIAELKKQKQALTKPKAPVVNTKGADAKKPAA